MSFIASMVSAALVAEIGVVGAGIAGAAATGAAGAGIGAGIGALTGGDIGDAALMGGIGGTLGGAGALAGGATMGANAIGLAADGSALTAAGGVAAPLAGEAAATGAATGAGQAVAPASQGIAQLQAQALANSSPLINTAPGTLNTALGQAQTVVPQMSSNALAQGGGNSFLSGIDSTIASQGAELAAHPELSYGQQAVQALTGAAPNSATVQYGGSALQGMATGAGVQGISNAVTGRPITEGMGTSAIAGGIGGAASTGLASQAGTGGWLGRIGEFAKAHDVLAPMGISMLASPVVDYLLGSGDETTMPNQKGIKPDFRYDTAAYRRKSNPVMYAHGGDVVQPSGISTLGGYSDGGRLLKGPGDGVSDSIPAIIGNKEPARLAEGEFVIPARIVSELGNGSTDAGAKQLYAMMDRVQHSRHKTMGKGKFAEDTHAKKHLPA